MMLEVVLTVTPSATPTISSRRCKKKKKRRTSVATTIAASRCRTFCRRRQAPRGRERERKKKGGGKRKVGRLHDISPVPNVCRLIRLFRPAPSRGLWRKKERKKKRGGRRRESRRRCGVSFDVLMTAIFGHFLHGKFAGLGEKKKEKKKKGKKKKKEEEKESRGRGMPPTRRLGSDRLGSIHPAVNTSSSSCVVPEEGRKKKEGKRERFLERGAGNRVSV